MNKKSLIKYKHGNEKGLMHYVIFEGDVVIMSAFKSHKVTHINEHGSLDISFDVDSEGFDTVKMTVETDSKYVQRVYDYMIETNNAYFKDEEEGLCVIKFKKN